MSKNNPDMLSPDFQARARALFARYGHFLPWISLAWGLLSGMLIGRDYENATRLALFTFGLVIFTLLLNLWFLWRSRTAANMDKASPFAKRIYARGKLIEWFGVTATQIYVQYILMFCLPLLVLAQAWITFSITLGCLASTLWDPWWQKLFKGSWYRACILCWGTLLAVAFLYPLFFPGWLGIYYRALGFIAFLFLVPWHRFRARARLRDGRLDRKLSVVDFVPVLMLACAAGIHTVVPALPPFPLLSVRLDKPHFTYVANEAKAPQMLSRVESAARVAELLSTGQTLCCVTPVIAPDTIRVPLVHEWMVNGSLLERITLPKIRGSRRSSSYRTFSCKSHFGENVVIESIECAVYLGGDIYLGRAVTYVEPFVQ